MNSLPRKPGIYMIKCMETGKFYIGSSRDMHHRWIVHKSELNTSKHKNIHLQNAWNKYGKDSFSVEVVEFTEVNNLIEREQYYLDTLLPFGDRGFNLGIKANAGLAGRKVTSEAKMKISVANKGRIMGDEQRAFLSAINTGRKRPDYVVDKIRIALSNRIIKDETRAKLSKSRLGKPLSESAKVKLSKHYLVIDPDGTEYYVHGLKQFCQERFLCYKSMNALAAGRRKTHNGWKCRKVED